MSEVYSSEKHCLDTIGLTTLWSKIKYFFATKTELASKADTSDLNKYYTKGQIDSMLEALAIRAQQYTGSDKYGESIMATEAEGGDDAQGGLSFWNAVERAPGFDGTSQMNIAEDSNTVEDE